MRVIVTGGAGFIGSHLVSRLIRLGHEVLVIDNFSTGIRSSALQQLDVLELDLSSPEFVNKLPKGDFDAICHLAAQSAGSVSADNPLYDLQANAMSTLLLSRWCIEKGISRFLYASSMVTYGNTDKSPVSEDQLCLPRSYYGVSKLTSEHYLRLGALEGLKPTSFRMFSVYGPGQDLENVRQGMVSIYLSYMLRGVEVPVTGSFERFRDFIYIDDVVDAWIRALNLSSTPQLVYNIGSGSGTTVRELLMLLLQTLDLSSDYPICEMTGSDNDQFGLYADINNIRNDLDWVPNTDLSEGLRLMYEWAAKIL